MYSYSDFIQAIIEHKKEVENAMAPVLANLIRRVHWHDNSKMVMPESEAFMASVPKLKQFAFGSPEYEQAKAEMGEGLKHHYETNRHHPEHYKTDDGYSFLDYMTLNDLLEMLADWVAASKRDPNGDPIKSIDFCCDKYKIDPRTKRFLMNTYIKYMVKTEENK